MRESDAFSWYMERDTVLRSTVVSVAWLDSSPDWEVLTERLDRATRLVPVFRQRVVEPPARLAPPRWTFDDGFDLSWHLWRMDSPAPHTAETAIAFACLAAMTGFDRSRPLWRFTLIEHLEEDRAALVMCMHHSLTDGVGAMQLALLLFDTDPGAPTALVRPDAPAGETPGWAGLVGESLTHNVRRVRGLFRNGAGSLLPAAIRAGRDPVGSARAVVETVGSIGRTIAPVNDTLSPVLTGRSRNRRLDLLTVRLDDLRAAAASAGGSVNDGFMAGAICGLRLYHERHGHHPDRLRVTLPISIRTPDDPVGGNRITLIRFAVPASGPDAAACIAEMSHLCRAARDERSLAYTDAIVGVLNLLPRAAVASMLKHIDFLASDVTGFPFPVWLAGARLTGQVAFGPTIGTALNLTLLSYEGTCSIGITMDTAAVADPELLAECLRAGFEEVLALAGEHVPVGLPLRVTPPGGAPSARAG